MSAARPCGSPGVSRRWRASRPLATLASCPATLPSRSTNDDPDAVHARPIRTAARCSLGSKSTTNRCAAQVVSELGQRRPPPRAELAVRRERGARSSGGTQASDHRVQRARAGRRRRPPTTLPASSPRPTSDATSSPPHTTPVYRCHAGSDGAASNVALARRADDQMVAADAEQLLVAAAHPGRAARRASSVVARAPRTDRAPATMAARRHRAPCPPTAAAGDPVALAADAMSHVYRRHADGDWIQTAAISSATCGLVRSLRMMRSRVGPRLPIGRPLIVADLAVVVCPLVHHQAQHPLVGLTHLGCGTMHDRRPLATLQPLVGIGQLVRHRIGESDDVVGDDAAAGPALYAARRVQSDRPQPGTHALRIGDSITEADEVQPCVLHGIVDIGGAAQHSTRRGFDQ